MRRRRRSPHLAALGDEVVVRIDQHQPGDVFVSGLAGHCPTPLISPALLTPYRGAAKHGQATKLGDRPNSLEGGCMAGRTDGKAAFVYRPNAFVAATWASG